jgi:hypothetical protein
MHDFPLRPFRSERVKAILFGVVALLAAGSAPLAAQVGHEPAKSPYEDLEYNQELTPMAGWVHARSDIAGVAPKSGPMVGLRYELQLVGPLALTSDVTGMFSERDVVNPLNPAKTRFVGTEKTTVYSADLGLALNLTGRKSWHSLVPQVRGGVGLMHASASDSTGFAFGTPFAFTFGGGLKFAPGRRWMLRGDVTDRIFHLSYPEAYYRLATDNTAVVGPATPKSFYTHHTALTVGVSYLFSR